jgi:4-methyl-5(b-hydroxyethyl)-thiazole monophosphate biosynthesis
MSVAMMSLAVRSALVASPARALHVAHVPVRAASSARFSRIAGVCRMLSSDSPTISVLVPIADDSEEIETACITDTLVRAGAKVTVASVMSGRLQCTMSRGLKVVADVSIEECADLDWDAIALPGGMPGAERLRDSAVLTTLLKRQSAAGKTTAAVCASPAVVFAAHDLLPPSSATCYPAPAFKEKIATWTDASAIVDGHIITSQGPGTSLQFALKLVEVLYDKDKAEEIAKAMLTTTA